MGNGFKNRTCFGDAEEIVAIFVSKYEKKSQANSIAILNSSDFPPAKLKGLLHATR